MINTYEKLEVWRKAHSIVLTIYFLTARFPAYEKFGLISQLRRAAFSVAVNIVEGNLRRTNKDFLQFLSIARGSLEELRYGSFLAFSLKYIDDSTYESLLHEYESCSKLLVGLIKFIQRDTRIRN